MGSSTKKKKEKKKDFQKTKLKVGKAKAKAANFTDTSFKSKAIVVNQQSLAEHAPDAADQFKHNLSLVSSKTDSQRRDALSYLTAQLSSRPPNNPVGTSEVLAKVLPLTSDLVASVRAQLLKLLRVLPAAEVKPHAERILLYVRAGMTHLSADLRSDTLGLMEWLLDAAGDEVVSCPGGWMRTLNSFSAMLGWNPGVASAAASKGWTSTGKSSTYGVAKGGAQAQARQMQVLARFLEAGFRRELAAPPNQQAYWANLYTLPRGPAPFAYLNLFGPARDEESEMYPDREARQRVFHERWCSAITKGTEEVKREGGAVGRAAATLDQVLKDGMADYP